MKNKQKAIFVKRTSLAFSAPDKLIFDDSLFPVFARTRPGRFSAAFSAIRINEESKRDRLI